MLHISEIFESVQGEGHHAGTWMRFIRMAGCNVGRYAQPNTDIGENVSVLHGRDTLRVLQRAHAVCTSAFGQEFVCDTDYRKSFSTTETAVFEMIRDAPEHHFCITGGEPLAQGVGLSRVIANVVDTAVVLNKPKWFHIETSGTVKVPKELLDVRCGDAVNAHGDIVGVWITCSPKAPFDAQVAPFVDEWKFVFDPTRLLPKDFALKVDQFLRGAGVSPENALVFVQPVNAIDSIDIENTKACLEVLQYRPHWRLSAQVHKMLGLR